MKLDYTAFKSIITAKGLRWQHIENTEFKHSYYFYAYDQGALYESVTDNPDEISDFETNYKSSSNQNIQPVSSIGVPVVSQTFEDVLGLYPKKKTYKNSVTAGQINFFDIEVDREKRICGGEYWIMPGDESKVHEDDYVEFSVIDKNDVLGLFEQYGLEIGTDILELCKFVVTDYVKKGSSAEGYHSQLYEGIKGTNQVIPGLYFRVAYDSNGQDNLKFLWRLYYYE